MRHARPLRPRSRLRAGCVVLAACCLLSGHARAGEGDLEAGWAALAPSRAALARDERARARELLFTRLLGATTTDAELISIARLGFHLTDRDLLQEMRAVLDERNDKAKARTAERILAEGWAYLGLARHYIQAQSNGSSIPMLFQDASKSAEDVLADAKAAALHDGAVLLRARVEGAQGRREQAIQALAAKPEGRSAVWAAAMNGLEGRLLYDRGAGRVGADGRPTDEGKADLTRAHALLTAALADPQQIGTNRDGIESLIARRAWASHRLGAGARAEAEYRALYDRGAQGRSLALRGLASLFTYDVAQHERALRELATEKGAEGVDAWAALARARIVRKTLGPALLAAQQVLALGETPAAWTLHASVLRAMGAWTEAEASYARALEADAAFLAARSGMELMAREVLAKDAPRALEMYEHLLRLRPNDPYVRNNLGFVLRDLVMPYTTRGVGNLDTIKPDAPAHVLGWLKRSVEVYAEAVALIDPEDDGQREVLEDWNLAGIVNDLALMLHYFTDVQDAPRAEQLYLRALRMTDYGFKDTYAPNLRRLYTHVLEDRELRWMRLAQKAQDAVMKEARRQDASVDLVADDEKRALARQDHERLRALLLDELGASPEKGPR